MRALLRHRHASETIIGRVAEYDEDRCFLVNLFRLAALLFEFGKGQGLVRMRLPAGQRIGAIDSRPLVLGVAAMSQRDFASVARRKLSSFAARPSGPAPMMRKSRILVTMTR
jgi:hypothetical protein